MTQWQQGTSRREKVDFIFDDQSKLGSAAVGWHDVFQDVMTEDEKFILTGTPIFRHDSEMLPLKAADMWAWSYHREITDVAKAAPPPRHRAQDVLFQCKYLAVGIDRGFLAKMVQVAGSGG